ncbi:MAG: DUF4834 domain-containing protein [Spirosomataceae bacterium]
MKYIFLVILLIAFVAPLRRFLFQILVGNQIAKQQKRYNDMMQRNMRKQGDVWVDPNPKNKPNSDSGQYVDFEEVKE